MHFSDYPMTGPLQLENLTKSKCWQPFIFMQTKTSWTVSFCSHMLHQLQSTANEQWMSKASNCISSSITNIRKHSCCVKNMSIWYTRSCWAIHHDSKFNPCISGTWNLNDRSFTKVYVNKLFFLRHSKEKLLKPISNLT